MKLLSKVFISTILLISAAASPVRSEILMDVDLNNREVGVYTKDMLNEDWNPMWGSGLNEGRVHIVGDSLSYDGRSLKVDYPEGGVGPAQGGAQWPKLITGAHEELYLSYYIMFPVGWDAPRNGKIPGLCGGECNTGGDKPNGSDGFSARYVFKSGVQILLYLYYMDQPSTYAESFKLSPTFKTGQWYKLTQRIKLNTVGQSDGEIQVWSDDVQVLYIQNLRLRTVPSIRVDRFLFSSFYGGGDASFAPVKDENIYFDNFKVYTAPSDVGVSPSQNSFDKGSLRPAMLRGSQLYDVSGQPVVVRETGVYLRVTDDGFGFEKVMIVN